MISAIIYHTSKKKTKKITSYLPRNSDDTTGVVCKYVVILMEFPTLPTSKKPIHLANKIPLG